MPSRISPGRAACLEPRGHVHRVTGREPLLRSRHHLPGVDTDPQLQRRSEVAHQPFVQLGQAIAQFGRRPHGPQRVVLVQDGNAEHRHHRVTDELLDRPSVTFHGDARQVEIPGHDCPQRLRVEPLAERGRARHVTEQHRHRLALLAPSHANPEDKTAGLTETGALPVLMTATPTTRHATSLEGRGRRPTCFLGELSVFTASLSSYHMRQHPGADSPGRRAARRFTPPRAADETSSQPPYNRCLAEQRLQRTAGLAIPH